MKKKPENTEKYMIDMSYFSYLKVCFYSKSLFTKCAYITF